MMQTIGKASHLLEDFHVSLTRTLVLKYHWIDSFVEALKNNADSYQSFTMELSDIKVYCNEDQSRTFIGITVESTNNSLQRLSQILDELLTEYQLPTFYEVRILDCVRKWILTDWPFPLYLIRTGRII